MKELEQVPFTQNSNFINQNVPTETIEVTQILNKTKMDVMS